MSNNNWNDPNQGNQNPGAQNPGNQGWDANNQGGYQAPDSQQGWNANPEAGASPQGGYQAPDQSWGAQSQPSAGGWDQNQPQNTGWDQPQTGYGDQGYGSIDYSQSYQQAPEYASWGKRALGWLLDYFLPGLVITTIVQMVSPNRTTTSTGSFETATNTTGNLVQLLLSLALYAGLSAYSAKTGQTWGRKVAKTQLVGEDGRPIGMGKSFIRYIAHFVDTIICFVGWLFPLWDKERQTLADKIMKTHVIDVSNTGPINVQQ